MTLLWWIAYVAQPIIMGITGGIVWWYTIETQRLRATAQRQIEVSQQQLQATQEQIETAQRPFIVIDPKWEEGCLQTFIIRNIGNSAAINVELVDGPRRLTTPILEVSEAIAVEVVEHHDNQIDIDVWRKKVEDGTAFPLDGKSRYKGVLMKIEYCNVAMMQYHTTERIRPRGVIIESSGKMGTYNPFA